MPGTLSDFNFDPGSENGVGLDGLEPGTRLVVRTTRSCYRFELLDAQRHARVAGGSMFREPGEVRIDGATGGGSVIKTGWIGIDMRLEFTFNGQRISTSPVTSVSIEEPEPDS